MLLQNDPDPSARSPLVYLLRIWPGGQTGESRFRLEEVTTRQGILFNDIQELMDFLAQRLDDALSDR
jgi:hypothetical protein